MRATFKLINSYFWKTIYGPILAFVFPAMLLAILGNIMRIQYIYPGIIALSMLFIGVLALPLAIMELKGSSLFKYIGASPVNPFKFSIVVILYYTFISVLTGFIIMFTAMIVFPKDVFPSDGFRHGIIGGLVTVEGFFSFYIASFVHLILVIAIGLAIATFSKTPQQALTFAIIIIIPSMFLSGMVLSVDIIAQSEAMQWISRLIPFRYSTGNLVIATTPLDQIGDYFEQIKGETYYALDKNGIDTLQYNSKLVFGENIITDVADAKTKADLVASLNIGDWNAFDGKTFSNDSSIIKIPTELITEQGKTYAVGDKPTPELLSAWNAKVNEMLSKNIGSVLVVDKPDTGTSSLDASSPLREFKYRLLSDTGDILDYYNGNTAGKVDPTNAALREAIRAALTDKGGDKVLFKLLFENGASKYSSDNSIFNWTEPWAVRRIPQMAALKDFFHSYLDAKEGGTDRFKEIVEKIKNGDTNFLDLFLEQTNKMYETAERSLNLIIPVLCISASNLYVYKKFNWSSR